MTPQLCTVGPGDPHEGPGLWVKHMVLNADSPHKQAHQMALKIILPLRASRLLPAPSEKTKIKFMTTE